MNSIVNLVLHSYSNTVYLCAAGCVRSYCAMQCTVLRYTGVDQGREKMSFLLLQDSDLKPTTPSSPFFWYGIEKRNNSHSNYHFWTLQTNNSSFFFLFGSTKLWYLAPGLYNDVQIQKSFVGCLTRWNPKKKQYRTESELIQCLICISEKSFIILIGVLL